MDWRTVEKIDIRPIYSYEECRSFVKGFDCDPCFSEPMLANEEQLRNNLIKSINQPERHRVIGVYRSGELMGLFAFLVLQGEKYVEMLVGLSRDREAYREMFRYLERNFQEFLIDFVFNPRNYLLRELLEAKNAEFETEQQKMVLGAPVLDVDTAGIELFSQPYAQQYFAIHTQDMYWTGEKVAATPEKFRTFLAVENGKVVGYLDVTHCFEENEPYDLVVLPQYRRRGYGRKLLAKALQMNQPKGMMLLVDVDDAVTIHLYESFGFVVAENQNSLTAHWKMIHWGENMDYQIRRAMNGDARTLAVIQTASWRSAFRGILSDEDLVRFTNMEQATNMYCRLLNEGKGHGYIGALEGKAHGIAWWDSSRDADMPEYAEILCIHSLPDHWGKGYGSQMMDRLLADIKEAGFQQVMLWVFTENTRARAFYEAKGFIPTDKIKPALGTTEVCYIKEL